MKFTLPSHCTLCLFAAWWLSRRCCCPQGCGFDIWAAAVRLPVFSQILLCSHWSKDVRCFDLRLNLFGYGEGLACYWGCFSTERFQALDKGAERTLISVFMWYNGPL